MGIRKAAARAVTFQNLLIFIKYNLDEIKNRIFQLKISVISLFNFIICLEFYLISFDTLLLQMTDEESMIYRG